MNTKQEENQANADKNYTDYKLQETVKWQPDHRNLQNEDSDRNRQDGEYYFINSLPNIMHSEYLNFLIN